MKKNKKFLLLVVIILGFIVGSIVVLPKRLYLSQRQNIDDLLDLNLGVLKEKITNDEKEQLGYLMATCTYLNNQRIRCNEFEKGNLQLYIEKMISKKLDEYTSIYLLDGARKEISAEYKTKVKEGKEKNTNKMINALETVLAPHEIEYLKVLTKQYNKGRREALYEIAEIIQGYEGLDIDVILTYLTVRNTLDLKACFNINEENKSLQYQTISPIMPVSLPNKEMDTYKSVWNTILEIFPKNAWNDFEKLCFCTDGEFNELASVNLIANDPKRWALNIDPLDIDTGSGSRSFYETIFHEYFHYLTLNDTQVSYDIEYDLTNYCDEELVSYKDSYINAFYKAFWEPIINDRLANMDSIYFYDRHQDSFVTMYAATSPIEDIAESFSYFILEEKPQGNTLKEDKIRFFYQYKELVEFRQYVRNKI